MPETRETRLKRLKMRSWRRGTKEMDLVLGQFADQHLSSLSDAELDSHEELMNENDQDLYSWISGQNQIPAKYKDALARIMNNFPQKK